MGPKTRGRKNNPEVVDFSKEDDQPSGRSVQEEIRKLKRKQTAYTMAFDETYEDLESALSATKKDEDLIEGLTVMLEAKEAELMAVDNEVLSLMNDSDISEKEYQDEVKTVNLCRKKATLLLTKAKKYLYKMNDCSSSTTAQVTQHHRLPKLELPKFGGEAKGWLHFWSQFESIHLNDSISTNVKFQYLIQCMKENSPAKEVVSSYPVTEANYILVLENLKERFGREDMLVEVYVRDLIGLILENANSKKSSDKFASLFVKLSAQLRALGTLGVTTDKCASILYPMVESCIPEENLVAWERIRSQQDKGTESTSEQLLGKLMEFLKTEVEGKERIRLAKDGFSTSCSEKKKEENKKSVPTASGLLAATSTAENNKTKEKTCVFCDKPHPSESCFSASSISHEEKKNVIEAKKRCFKCLGEKHHKKDCKKPVKCIVCGKMGHWAVMCYDLEVKNKSETVKLPDTGKPDTAEIHKNYANTVKNPHVLLQTIVVRVFGKNGTKLVRAILDTGSQKSYVLKKVAEEVGLPVIGHEEVIHQLFGGQETTMQKHKRYKLKISDPDAKFVCDFDVSDIPQISSDIEGVPGGPWLTELQNQGINLTDIGDEKEIQILIGSDVFGNLLTGKRLELKSGPVALETQLGWTLMRKLRQPRLTPQSRSSSMLCSRMLNQDQVKNLWDLDVIGIEDPGELKTRAEMEAAAVEHFQQTVTKSSDGRYEVHLPWIEGHDPLPCNKGVAVKRLESATKALLKDGTVELYNDVMTNWLNENIIEEVPEDEQSTYGYFLPHRPVYKPDSTTTPIRPVFDASCKSKGNPSLNDCLEKGPNLLEQVPAIISRFRLNNVGVVSDIRKAFIQMSVHVEHRNFLRFLWWEDTSCSKLKQFRHCRVVFGVSSSPFLLGSTIFYHLSNWKSQYSDTVELLKKSFYVDNCVTSLSSTDEAIKFKAEAITIMQHGKFDLQGWEIGPCDEDRSVPVFGMVWNMKQDTLTCDWKKLTSMNVEEIVTKKKILSIVNSVYDPVDYTSVFTIIPKILLQDTWKLKIGWDSQLPADISKKFKSWFSQIGKMSKVKIPRQISIKGEKSDDEKQELHVFTDASGSAYAACVFIRSQRGDQVRVQLVQAKARVATLKPMTIPRLKLLGCLIGAKLGYSVIKMLDIKLPVFYWTDSTTALYWFQHEGNWGTFVQNRVKEIRSLTSSPDSSWCHVPGVCNPADLPSRGCSVDQLVERRWWEGPAWLYEEKSLWPKCEAVYNEQEIYKKKMKTVVSNLNMEDAPVLKSILNLGKNSTYNHIIRIGVLMKRFIFNLRGKVESTKSGQIFLKNTGSSDVDEITAAEISLVKLVQKSVFKRSQDSRLKKYGAFENQEGVIRVKTRLMMGDFNHNFKYPAVLPDNHEFVKRLIWKEHISSSHGGVSSLQSQLRETYCILNSRRTIRKVLMKCFQCRKIKSLPFQVPEPPLPKNRIDPTAAPFEVTGVDLCGPLYLRGSKKLGWYFSQAQIFELFIWN